MKNLFARFVREETGQDLIDLFWPEPDILPTGAPNASLIRRK